MRGLLLLALALASCRAQPAPAEAKPDLALLTSLPIAFSETFSLDAPAHPLLAELEATYAVRPVDGPEQLSPGGLLLAIQPQALTAERLVALDAWVREGGRLVLLVDPRLRWESSRPLGDRFRPPFEYPDLGLLAHWGLTLTPNGTAETEVVERMVAGGAITTSDPGALASTGRCKVEEQFVATCRLGRGLAVVIADADFAMIDEPRNRDAVVSLLEAARRS